MPNSDMAQQQTDQHAFLARGLVARDRARETGRYISADQVLTELDLLLKKAQRTIRTQPESRPR